MAGKAAQWQKLRTNLSQYRVGTCVGGVQPRLEINDLAMVSAYIVCIVSSLQYRFIVRLFNLAICTQLDGQ